MLRRAGPPNLLSLMMGVALAGCGTRAPLRALDTPACQSGAPSVAAEAGSLVVYSATYAATSEQSEYPVHTDYSIFDARDRLLQHVRNTTGSFNAHPARITLPSGEYYVRAQYGRGGFAVFCVSIDPGKTTTVDLENDPQHLASEKSREPIRLPGGRVIGWRAVSG